MCIDINSPFKYPLTDPRLKIVSYGGYYKEHHYDKFDVFGDRFEDDYDEWTSVNIISSLNQYFVDRLRLGARNHDQEPYGH